MNHLQKQYPGFLHEWHWSPWYSGNLPQSVHLSVYFVWEFSDWWFWSTLYHNHLTGRFQVSTECWNTIWMPNNAKKLTNTNKIWDDILKCTMKNFKSSAAVVTNISSVKMTSFFQNQTSHYTRYLCMICGKNIYKRNHEQ